MHNKYNEYVDQQHAPDKLIEMTKRQMELEEDRLSSHADPTLINQKKRPFKLTYAAAMAACICGIVIISLSYFRTSPFTYSEIQDNTITARGSISSLKREITLQEYDALMGTQFNQYETLGDFTRTNATAYVTYKDKLISSVDKDREIESDLCKLIFEHKDGKTLTITASKAKVTAPNVILSISPNSYSDYQIYLARKTQTLEYFAYFQKNGIHYYLEGKQISEHEMNKAIKELLK